MTQNRCTSYLREAYARANEWEWLKLVETVVKDSKTKFVDRTIPNKELLAVILPKLPRWTTKGNAKQLLKSPSSIIRRPLPPASSVLVSHLSPGP